MNKIVLVRLFPFNNDSRAVRYVRNLYPSVTLFWNEIDSEEVKSFPFMNSRTPLRPVIYLLNFFYLIFFSAFQVFYKKRIIIAMDLDSYTASSIFGLLGSRVVFDCVDPFSESRFRKLIYLKKVINGFEQLMMKSARLVIFPSDVRKLYYKYTPNNCLVIRNIPDISPTSHFKKSLGNSHSDLIIGYIGGITDSRYLDKLCDLALEFSFINVIFFGDGPYRSELEKKYCGVFNISFKGRFDYSDLENCYKQIDICFACYDPVIDFHRFAAPNKFYESIVFKKPVIVNREVLESVELITNNLAVELNFFTYLLRNNTWKIFFENTKVIYPDSESIKNIFLSDIENLKRKL